MTAVDSARQWFRHLRSSRRSSLGPRRSARRLGIEQLEDRITPSTVSFNPSTAIWYLRAQTSPGATTIAPFQYGSPGWIPVMGDWDGSGTTTIGVVNPTTMTWYLRNSNSPGAPSIAPFQFGAPGWIPVVGDWDGNGTTTIGAVDPTTMTWYLRNSNSSGAPSISPFQFGARGWTPVVGDWNGEWTTTIGAVDPSSETWYLRESNSPGAPSVTPFQFGSPGWTPVVGDWDGNGTTTVGVVNPSGTWYVRDENGAGAPDVAPFSYGAPGWDSLSATGTGHALSGSALTEYNATVNETDAADRNVRQLLGSPTSAAQAVSGVSGATVVSFQGGSIYSSATTGSHVLYGAIATEYAATASLTDAYGESVQKILGLPTGDAQAITGVQGGSVVTFQGGEIDWSAATGAVAVYGAIETEYRTEGGPSGSLGLPLGAEHAWAGGRIVQFQNGSISWSPTTGALILGPTYQASNGSGQTVTYVLQGGYIDETNATTLKQVSGPSNVTKVVIDDTNTLYALASNGVLWQVNGLTAVQAATNVTQVAIDSAGEVAMLQGPYAYLYITGGLTTGGGGISGSGQPTEYALDSEGRLYAVTLGVLTVADTSLSIPQQIDTGVTQVAVDSAGELVMLKGPNAYEYVLSNGVTLGGSGASSSSGPIQYVLDGEGRLFALNGGILTVAATSSSVIEQVSTGVTRMAEDSAGEIIALQGSREYEYFMGALTSTGSTVGSTPQYAVDVSGKFYTLLNGQLTEQDSSLATINTIASNVTELGTNSSNQVVYQNAVGIAEEFTAVGWTVVGTGGVTTSDGSGWFLGLNTVDSKGNRDIYRISNGHVTQMPGAATALQVSGGSVSLVTAGGGFSVEGPNGPIPILKDVYGVTPESDGSYNVNFGPWLQANVKATVNSSGTVSLAFSNVQLNAGSLVNAVDSFIGQLQNLTKPLAPLFTPLAQTLGFEQILSRAGITSSLDVSDLIVAALNFNGHAAAASELQELGTVVKAINALPEISGSTVSLGNFTATETNGVLQLNSLPGGDLLQQLGGGYATFASELSNVGVTLPSEATLLGVLLGRNTNVSLLTYTLPNISVLNLPALDETIATIITPIPGVTLNGEIVGNISLQVGGSVSLKASGLTSGNLGLSLSYANAIFSAGVSVGPAVSIDLGVNGLSLVGYQVEGLFGIDATATFSTDGFKVLNPSFTNSVDCHWVGPTLDLSELGGATIEDVDPYVLVFNLEVQAANGLLQQWGLPTVPNASDIISDIQDI
jgi:LGFP repeat